MKTITYEMTDEFKTRNGGFLGKVLRVLTGTNRPKKGWRKNLIGTEIHELDIVKIVELNAKQKVKPPKIKKIRHVKSVTVIDEDDVPCWHQDWTPEPKPRKPLGEYLNSSFPPWDERCLTAN